MKLDPPRTGRLVIVDQRMPEQPRPVSRDPVEEFWKRERVTVILPYSKPTEEIEF